MDTQKVDMFMLTNGKFFPPAKSMFLKEKLLTMDESRFSMISSIELKDPTTLLIISIFLGSLGIDRFMLGDTGMGVLKLLTAGCCGILTIIDWFSVSDRTKELNFNNLMTML